MKKISPHIFYKNAVALRCSPEYLDAITVSAEELSCKNLPIVFTLNHLARILELPFFTLHSVVERKFCPYKIFSIRKRRGGYRKISFPQGAVANVQQFIKENILDSDYVNKKIHSAVFSYRKNVSILSHAQKHIGAKWVIKIDINDFFGSIHEPIIFDFFLSLGYSPLLSLELSRLVTWPKNYNFDNVYTHVTTDNKYRFYSFSKLGVLPQGVATSPQLSNIVFEPLDNELEQISSKYKTTYTRYADDIYFSCYKMNLNKARELLIEARDTIKKYNYTINPSKTKIFSPRAKKIVTGLVVEDNGVFLQKKYKDSIKRDVHFIEKYGFEHQSEHLKFKSINRFIEKLQGQLCFAKSVEPNFGERWLNRFYEQCEKYNMPFPHFFKYR